MSVNLGETKITDIFKTTGGTGGTSDYNELTNKPQINGVTLTGNKTSEDLGIITGITDAYTKEETQALIESSITGKADKIYVDGQLDLKADKSTTYTKTEVDNSIASITQNINNKLANKADKSDTYTKEETIRAIQSNTTDKADITYVDAQLNLKADKSDTYTKEEVDDMFDNPTITGDTLPIGSITLWSGTTTPTNWLLCDGREVSRETYSELFAAIGTVWGAGDGSTSFNLPDFTDKFAFGAGGDVDLAETGGEKEVTLTVDQIPKHQHNNGTSPENPSGAYKVALNGKGYTNDLQVPSSKTGGGQAHNNMPPYVGSYYIIKAKQSAGVIANVVDTLESTSNTDALSANMGKKLKDLITPVQLYSGSTASSSITLSDNASNYRKFEIRVTGNEYSTDRIKEETITVLYPNNKEVGHSICWFNNDNSQVYCGQIRLSIKDNKITVTENSIGTVGSEAAYFSNGFMMKIVQVLGYKKI